MKGFGDSGYPDPLFMSVGNTKLGWMDVQAFTIYDDDIIIYTYYIYISRLQ